MGAHVLYLLRRAPGVPQRKAHRARGLGAVGQWLGHVVRVARAAVTEHLPEDTGVAPHRVPLLLKHEHRSALSHHKPVAVLLEGSARRAGVVVARAHRADKRECAVREGRERRFRSAGQHDIRLARAYGPESLSNCERAAGARVRVRQLRAV